MKNQFALLALIAGVFGCGSTPAKPVDSASPKPKPAAAGAAGAGNTNASHSGGDMDVSSPMRSRCAVIQKHHNDLINDAGYGDAPLDKDIAAELRRMGGCIPAGKGAWTARLVSLGSVPMPVQESSGSMFMLNVGMGVVEVVYVDEKGTAPEVGSGQLLEIVNFGNLSVNQRTAYDYDGDGIAEFGICISAGGGNLDDEYASECRLLSAKSGTIQTYEGLPNGIVIANIDDIDEDRRPDVLSMAPYYTPCEKSEKKTCIEPSTPSAPGFLYHALPDGKFTPSDDLARLYAEKKFPYDLNQLFDHDEPPPGSDVIALRAMGANAVRGAYAFGEDPKKIRAALAKYRKGYCANPKNCPYFDAMEKWPSSPFWPARRAKP